MSATTLNTAEVPPHGCGDSDDGPLCFMELDGTCPKETCAYYNPHRSPTMQASISKTTKP